MELELKCKCGGIGKLVKPDDSYFSEDEGWYTRLEGDIEVCGSHDQVCFRCKKCENEIWMFT